MAGASSPPGTASRSCRTTRVASGLLSRRVQSILAFLTRRCVPVCRRDSVESHGASAGGCAAAGGGGGAAAAQGRERGADQNRTGVRGFAGLCLTTRPRRPDGRMVSGRLGYPKLTMAQQSLLDETAATPHLKTVAAHLRPAGRS